MDRLPPPPDPNDAEAPPASKLCMLPGVEITHVYGGEFTTDYAEQQARPVIDACLRLGLDPGFVPFFSKHLSDLHLVIANDRFDVMSTEAQQRGIDPTKSFLDVRPLAKIPKHQRDNDPEGPRPENVTEWSRLLVVTEKDVQVRSSYLAATFKKLNFKPNEDADLKAVAVDWIFAEKSMEALGNSCFMKNTLGTYFVDLNGQYDWYQTEYTVTTEYMKEYPEEVHNIEDDFRNLQLGFGFMMLHESLLARHVFRNAKMADITLQRLRNIATNAFRAEDIMKRLSNIKPTEDQVRAYQALSDSLPLTKTERRRNRRTKRRQARED